MQNPKTTIAGYLGILGALMAALGTAFPGRSWSSGMTALGLALSGSSGLGNIAAKDGEH